jgi:hypothetical protein
MAWVDYKVFLVASRLELEVVSCRTIIFARSAVWTDQINGECPQVVQQDRSLLIPVGVELHPALLHEDSAEVFGPIEGIPRKIAFHGRSPLC